MSEYNIQMNKYNALNAEYDQLYPATKIENVDGLDTALANKPSKSPVHVDDANDVTKSGFYTCKTNIPFGYGLANVLAVGDIDDPSNVFTQIAFGVNLNPTNRNAIAVRCYVPGEGFKDWEWFNPPMSLGVEYRTTERYQGKPVYAIAVDFGNLPNATTKELIVSGVSSPDKVVSIFGYTSNRKTIPTFSYGWSAISTLNDAIALDANAHPAEGLTIHVATQQNRSGATAVIVVKYTKSTD